MVLDIRLPGLGESIAEGTIVRWFKQPGERVDRDEDLVLVSTDKIEVALPCPKAGAVRELLAAPGQTVAVGTVIARLDSVGEEAASAGPDPVPLPVEATPPGETPAEPRDPAARNRAFRGGQDGKLFLSPIVRRLAREHDLDLTGVEGRGARGRVTRRDVEAAVARGAARSGFTPPEGGFRPGSPGSTRAVLPFDAATRERHAPEIQEGDRVEDLSPLGRAMAQHMALTWWRSPHVSTLIEVDMARISEHRRAANQPDNSGKSHLSFTHYVSRAVAVCLGRHPGFNASLTDDLRRIVHHQVNLGVAVAKPDGGLIVPVLRQADGLSLRGHAQALSRLTERARAGEISRADLSGGTFTVTNVGSNGNLASWPLINQPQCAILAMGAVTKRVVVVTDPAGHDAISIRPMMFVTLTYDHRVNDGAASGRFLADLRRTLESWNEDA